MEQPPTPKPVQKEDNNSLTRRDLLLKAAALTTIAAETTPTITTSLNSPEKKSNYLETVEQRFGVKIMLGQIGHDFQSFGLQIKVTEELGPEHQKALCDFLIDQLSRYPENFLSDNKISRIVVAKELEPQFVTTGGLKEIAGRASTHGSIAITFPYDHTKVASPINKNSIFNMRFSSYATNTLHHELFHEIDDVNDEEREKRWDTINTTRYTGYEDFNDPEKTRNNTATLTEYANASRVEERAVIAEDLMMGNEIYFFIQNLKAEIKNEEDPELAKSHAASLAELELKMKDVISQYAKASNGMMDEAYFKLPIDKRARYLYLKEKYEKK